MAQQYRTVLQPLNLLAISKPFRQDLQDPSAGAPIILCTHWFGSIFAQSADFQLVVSRARAAVYQDQAPAAIDNFFP